MWDVVVRMLRISHSFLANKISNQINLHLSYLMLPLLLLLLSKGICGARWIEWKERAKWLHQINHGADATESVHGLLIDSSARFHIWNLQEQHILRLVGFRVEAKDRRNWFKIFPIQIKMAQPKRALVPINIFFFDFCTHHISGSFSHIFAEHFLIKSAMTEMQSCPFFSCLCSAHVPRGDVTSNACETAMPTLAAIFLFDFKLKLVQLWIITNSDAIQLNLIRILVLWLHALFDFFPISFSLSLFFSLSHLSFHLHGSGIGFGSKQKWLAQPIVSFASTINSLLIKPLTYRISCIHFVRRQRFTMQ